MPVLNNEQKKIADELDKIQIEQLHKATLSFSNNSQENKKLCVTVLTAIYALLVGIYKEETLTYFDIIDNTAIDHQKKFMKNLLQRI